MYKAKDKKPVHLVKNMAQVPEKKRFPANEPIWGLEKIDGVYAYGLMLNGDNRIFSRTGNQCHSLKHLEEELALIQCKPAVAIFEVHVPGWPVNRINGAFSRQSEQFTEAIARIHQVIPYDDFVAGYCEVPYKLRWVAAMYTAQLLPSFKIIEVEDIENEEEAHAHANSIIKVGGEGGVYVRVNGHWQAGKKNEWQMKIKQEESWDLIVEGWEQGDADGKYAHTLGKLLCRWRKFGKADGELCQIPVSGMTDTQRNEWYECFELIDGCIIKVDAMRITEHGMLREARFKEVRIDKVLADIV